MSTVSEIVIEQLRDDEKNLYEKLLVESYSQYEHLYPTKEMWENYKKDIRESVHNPKADKIIVAKLDNDIIGGLHLFVGSEKAYSRPELNIHSTIIRMLGVHPNGRGHGIAKKLINESFKFARNRGDEFIYLHTTDMMSVAIRLYEKLGFVRDETRDMYKGEILVKAYKYKL